MTNDRSQQPVEIDRLREELVALVGPDLIALLFEQRDATRRVIQQLPKGQWRAWELAGLHLVRTRRFHEAITVFEALYDALLEAQDERGGREHKGMPLVWIRDCRINLDHTALAKRAIMLTLIEDAIGGQGVVDPDLNGSYFRIVWNHGMSDTEVQRYVREIAAFARDHEEEARYPERVLQELDKLWMTDFPTTAEAFLYPVNRRYVRHLLRQTGDGSGAALEFLADYLLASMPGCRTHRRKRSHSTDYDIVCSLDGFDLDFRSELGRYFVCECKDWGKPADFGAFAKFARVLDSTKSRFGILFSREGITGGRLTRDAAREQLKLFQDRGIIIVVIDLADIEAVIAGVNFIALLREKYEAVRLDLMNPGGGGRSLS